MADLQALVGRGGFERSQIMPPSGTTLSRTVAAEGVRVSDPVSAARSLLERLVTAESVKVSQTIGASGLGGVTAAHYPLEVTFPKPSGAAGTGLDSTNKVFVHYPGIPYRYFAAAVGGVPPFVFSMSGQPSGMSIDSDTGAVTWSNPTTGTHSNITVTVTDQESATDSATYTLTVSTTGFRFIKTPASGGSDANDGLTPSTAWATIDKLYDDTNNIIAFFYGGTYDFTGVPNNGAADPTGVRMEFFAGTGRCNKWCVVPGETVVLDFNSAHVHPAATDEPSLALAGPAIWFDGFHCIDGYSKFLWIFRSQNRGATIINNTFERIGPGVNVSNPGCIMYTRMDGFPSYNELVVNNTCIDVTVGTGGTATQSFVRCYNMYRPYIAFNTGLDGCVSDEMVTYKDNIYQYMDYRNNFDVTGVASDGNHHLTETASELWTSGEMWYSRYKGTNYALEFNQDGQCNDPLYYDRCTLHGRIHARQLQNGGDGPFTFRNCVIVNSDGAGSPWPYFHDDPGATDASQIDAPTSLTPSAGQNLAGATGAGIVDENSLLIGSYRTSYLGSKGHEIS